MSVETMIGVHTHKVYSTHVRMFERILKPFFLLFVITLYVEYMQAFKFNKVVTTQTYTYQALY